MVTCLHLRLVFKRIDVLKTLLTEQGFCFEPALSLPTEGFVMVWAMLASPPSMMGFQRGCPRTREGQFARAQAPSHLRKS